MEGFSEYARPAPSFKYATICLNMSEQHVICLNISEYLIIDRVLNIYQCEVTLKINEYSLGDYVSRTGS